MEKKEYDHFIGLWRHPNGGWEIKYQQAGKKKSEYSKEKHVAELRAEYWKATLGAPPSEQEEAYEHPVFFWERKLREVADLLLSNPSDRDIAGACRSVASAATAALRAVKYIPAPALEASPDSAPITGDVSNMTTEEMERHLATSNPPSKGE